MRSASGSLLPRQSLYSICSALLNLLVPSFLSLVIQFQFFMYYLSSTSPSLSPLPQGAMFLLQPCPPCVTVSSLCAGVFGAGGRQEGMSPPTAAAPHIRGHPSGDMGYGMNSAQCACIHTCCTLFQHCVHIPLFGLSSFSGCPDPSCSVNSR